MRLLTTSIAVAATIAALPAQAATPAFTVTQLELKAGMVIAKGTTAKAGSLISIAPFGKSVKSNAKKEFSFSLPATKAKLVTCSATLKSGLSSKTLVISGCGPQGPAGPAGAKGADGAVGPVGATGATGPQGPAGVQGPKGDTGATGSDGIASVVGFSGGVKAAGIGNTNNKFVFISDSTAPFLVVGQKKAVVQVTASLYSKSATAFNVDLAVCYQPESGGLVSAMTPGGYLSVTALPNTKLTYSMPGLVTLQAGSYIFGLCVRHSSANTLGGDYQTGTLFLTN